VVKFYDCETKKEILIITVGTVGNEPVPPESKMSADGDCGIYGDDEYFSTMERFATCGQGKFDPR